MRPALGVASHSFGNRAMLTASGDAATASTTMLTVAILIDPSTSRVWPAVLVNDCRNDPVRRSTRAKSTATAITAAVTISVTCPKRKWLPSAKCR